MHLNKVRVNDEFFYLYSSSNIIRVIKSKRVSWVGHVAGIGETRVTHSILVENSARKTTLGRPRRRWEDKSKTDLEGTA